MKQPVACGAKQIPCFSHSIFRRHLYFLDNRVPYNYTYLKDRTSAAVAGNYVYMYSLGVTFIFSVFDGMTTSSENKIGYCISFCSHLVSDITKMLGLLKLNRGSKSYQCFTLNCSIWSCTFLINTEFIARLCGLTSSLERFRQSTDEQLLGEIL
jgi:hypothetical protein